MADIGGPEGFCASYHAINGFSNTPLACRLTCLLRTSCLCCVRLAVLADVVAGGGPAGLFASRPPRARGFGVPRPPGGGAGAPGVLRTPPPPPGGGGPPARARPPHG